MTAFDIIGRLADDDHVLRDTAGVARKHSYRVRLDNGAVRESIDLLVGRVPDVMVTSYYLAVDIASRSLLISQSYFDIVRWFPDMHPIIDGARFRLIANARVIEAPHVLIGGPVDGVWYHWMVSWCARILIFKQLKPDLFADPTIRFLIDAKASQPPYRDMILALGVDEARVTYVRGDEDLLLKDAILVSFPDQRFLYPDLVRDFASTIKAHFLSGVEILRARRSLVPTWISNRLSSTNTGRRRIFTSRQAIEHPKRRIHNFEEIEPILTAFGFEIVNLAEVSAQDQVKMFAEAEFVLGVHGSDLTDLMFCDAGTGVLVIENQRNVTMGIAASLDILCQIVGAKYHRMVVGEHIVAGTDYSAFPDEHNRDVIIPPDDLRNKLLAIGCKPLDRIRG